MNKQDIIQKVNELIAAPSCCAEVKSAAQDYLKAAGTAEGKSAADKLSEALNKNVNTIDELIAFTESDMGKKIFGAEQAGAMAKKAHEFKNSGGKYCFCPACQAGSVIYENKELLA